MRPAALLIVVALLSAAGQPPDSRAPAPAALFRDVTRESRIQFTRHSAPDKRFIVESMSGGVALLEIDGDGLLDIYFVDSLTVATAHDPRASRSALYRNRGDGRSRTPPTAPESDPVGVQWMSMPVDALARPARSSMRPPCNKTRAPAARPA